MIIQVKKEWADLIATMLEELEGRKQDWKKRLEEQLTQLRLEAEEAADGRFKITVDVFLTELSRHFQETCFKLADLFAEENEIFIERDQAVIVG